MGVGYAIDLMMCTALGVGQYSNKSVLCYRCLTIIHLLIDMYDCVYPSRTARFGTALVGLGRLLKLKTSAFAEDLNVLDPDCDCTTCQQKISRAYLHCLLRDDATVGCHLLTVHNIRFQMRFMSLIRESIIRDEFVPFIRKTLDFHYESPSKYPDFVQTFLKILNLEFD